MLSGIEDVNKEILKNLSCEDLVSVYEVNNFANKIMNSEDFLVWIADREVIIPTDTFKKTISDYKMVTNDPLRYIFDKLNNKSTVSDNIYHRFLKRHGVKETDIFDVAMKERSLRVIKYIYTHSKDLETVNDTLRTYKTENDLCYFGKDLNIGDIMNSGENLHRYYTKKILMMHDCRKQIDEEEFLTQAITANPNQYMLILCRIVSLPFPVQLRISIRALTDKHCWVKMLDHIEKLSDEYCFDRNHVRTVLDTLYGVAENIGYTNLLQALDERVN
jgi:hypothetical protein